MSAGAARVTRHPPGRFLNPAQCAAWAAELEARWRALDSAEGWRPAADRDGLRIEVLPGDARGDCVRGAVTLKGRLEELARVLLLDEAEHVDWDPTLDLCVVQDALDPGDTLVQIPVRSGLHPLVRDRELLYHERAQVEAERVLTLGASRPFPGVPPLPGCLRAALHLSARGLEPHPSGGWRYHALWQTDLGGWLPRWAVTRGQVQAMLAEHLRFRARFSGP